jgi:hypothetical protein
VNERRLIGQVNERRPIGQVNERRPIGQVNERRPAAQPKPKGYNRADRAEGLKLLWSCIHVQKMTQRAAIAAVYTALGTEVSTGTASASKLAGSRWAPRIAPFPLPFFCSLRPEYGGRDPGEGDGPRHRTPLAFY